MASIHMTHDVLNCMQYQDKSELLILILLLYSLTIQEHSIDNSPIDS